VRGHVGGCKIGSEGGLRTCAHQVFDTVSAPRAGSLAASRKKTMERVHAGLVRDNKERLVARWLGQSRSTKIWCLPEVT
jgi:hypothetical protein